MAEMLNALEPEVQPFPIRQRPWEFTPRDPLVLEILRQFRTDWDAFRLRIAQTQGDVGGAGLFATSPTNTYMLRLFELADKHRGEPVALEALTTL